MTGTEDLQESPNVREAWPCLTHPRIPRTSAVQESEVVRTTYVLELRTKEGRDDAGLQGPGTNLLLPAEGKN
jgi:hypothetical protein